MNKLKAITELLQCQALKKAEVKVMCLLFRYLFQTYIVYICYLEVRAATVYVHVALGKFTLECA